MVQHKDGKEILESPWTCSPLHLSLAGCVSGRVISPYDASVASPVERR